MNDEQKRLRRSAAAAAEREYRAAVDRRAAAVQAALAAGVTYRSLSEAMAVGLSTLLSLRDRQPGARPGVRRCG